ncbi:class IV adenylate cyclase [Nocardiopsis tropica]|uniref:Class IV adenylate cyclase n=1 Tax=Nocardiopsis tropica TaxID=109330 RepID=A0ABU7KHW4_9ACTN|nr:class IV adenylate cyclase [Nocardiopsis umidischolae]MEE2048894.1 class IV adenylate cyclase [Nocardiopsis umidischolae]
MVRQRHYYNRYLTKWLANPLWDAKQLVLFRNIPMSDSVMLTEALTGVRESFATHNLTRVYAVLAPGKEWSSVTLIEVERKRVLENRQVLERCLEDLGFVATGPVVEVDTYYSRPDVDFLETVECLRVREREDGCEVTYKPASSATTHSAGDVVAKQETNVVLADAAQAAHAHGLLEALGMVLLARVEKAHTCYRTPERPELSVMVDTVTGLGSFVETEIVSEGAREETVHRLEETERLLGLWSHPVVGLPYRDLVLGVEGRIRRTGPVPPRDRPPPRSGPSRGRAHSWARPVPPRRGARRPTQRVALWTWQRTRGPCGSGADMARRILERITHLSKLRLLTFDR